MAMTLRLSPVQEQQLSALAEKKKLSRQQVISLALEEAYERDIYNEKLDIAIDSVLTRYAEALERLGQ